MLMNCYIRDVSRVAERLTTKDLKKFRNIRRIPKLRRIIA